LTWAWVSLVAVPQHATNQVALSSEGPTRRLTLFRERSRILLIGRLTIYQYEMDELMNESIFRISDSDFLVVTAIDQKYDY
jgi:hypothetical protein